MSLSFTDWVKRRAVAGSPVGVSDLNTKTENYIIRTVNAAVRAEKLFNIRHIHVNGGNDVRRDSSTSE
jgi:hypothetical protein